MALNERTRHELYEAARRTLGEQPAETLMEMLPPVGWADVATKHDLAALETRLELRFDAIDARFGALDARIEAAVNKGILHLVFWLVPFFLAYGAALVRLG